MDFLCKYCYGSQKLQLYSILLIICVIWSVDAYKVVIESPKAALIGGYANFSATLFDGEKVANKSPYKYMWADNANPQHRTEIESNEAHCTWSIEYPYNASIMGTYEVTLEVYKAYIFSIKIATSTVTIEVTNKLHGDFTLTQNNAVLTEQYVSTRQKVNHSIVLPSYEYDYLHKIPAYIQTYWYRNCTYMGVSNGLFYEATYNQTNVTYLIEALVVVSLETNTSAVRIPPTINITTTSMPITAAIKPIHNDKESLIILNKNESIVAKKINTTSEVKPNVALESVTTTEISKKMKRDAIYVTNSTTDVKNESLIFENPINGALNERDEKVRNKSIDNASFAIINPNTFPNFITAQQQELINSLPWRLKLPPSVNCATNQFTSNSNFTYSGYFNRIITPNDPISNFTFSKKTWLPKGYLLNMHVQCDGSPIIEYCTLVFNAPYNATGKEICPLYYKLTECKFNYTRYFSESKTVLFFIRNKVSEVVNQVTINIYKVKKQSQLSVVVVPVSFTLIAIILVVFGVSYYVQKRNRFNVEVADFNFGETQSVDMEYKTFQERLCESISEVLPQKWRYHHSDSGPDNENSSNAAVGTGISASNSDVPYNALN